MSKRICFDLKKHIFVKFLQQFSRLRQNLIVKLILNIVAICNLGAKGQQLGHPYTMLPTANAGWLYSLSIDPHKVEVKGQFNNN